MLTKSPEYSSSDYIRYAIYLVLLGACAARQLPPDPDVAGVDTVFMPMRPNAHTVTIHTRFPPVDTPLRNFLVITAIATVNNQGHQMTRYEICNYPEVRCFVSNGLTDEVCVRVAATNRPSILVRHMQAQADYYVTSCPIRPNDVVSCEIHQGETLVCVRGRVQ